MKRLSLVWSAMSDARAHLAMYLEGPMQSWGYASRYGRRTTLSYPTRSALVGILMAALGAPRNDTDTITRLNRLACEILSLHAEGRTPTRWTDYHTVGGGYDLQTQRQFMPRKANNAAPGTVLTSREYLSDARFGAVLSGDRKLLEECQAALVDPTWGVWLGRKTCIPTGLIGQGVHDTRELAVATIKEAAQQPVGRSVREVRRFDEGTDSLMDVPLDFSERRFSQRRVSVEGPEG